MRNTDNPAPIAEQFNLPAFTAGLIADLQQLREGQISVHDARARADLAKQALRGVQYMITAQKFLTENAKPINQVK